MPKARARRTRGAPALVVLAFIAVAGCTDDGAVAPVATNEVRIPGPWVFEPDAIEVPVGSTVTWTNDGGQAHTVTFTDHAPARFDVTIEPGGTASFTFDVLGEYPYECTFHPPDMTGVVIVTGPEAGGPLEGNATARAAPK